MLWHVMNCNFDVLPFTFCVLEGLLRCAFHFDGGVAHREDDGTLTVGRHGLKNFLGE